MRWWLLVAAMAGCDDGAAKPTSTPAPAEPRGKRLETMTWYEAKDALTSDTVVVIPLGAASKEHGPHLRLENDRLIADYFANRVLEAADVVMAPTVTYHHYPAFAEYAGSISLRLETARDLVIDIVTSLAAFGPRRFYVLNTGMSTVKALAPAAEALAKQHVLLRYTELDKARDLVAQISEQEGGTHADEIETSMMLVIAPQTVRMDKAVKDYDASGRPGLSPNPDAGKTHSPTGVWGDATLATRQKGEVIVEARMKQMLADIEALRSAPLP